ncbi:MAG: hypothetical protein LBT13_09380 [Treponema sp.]|jgi:hypothetical protein|nr:hypothetical protein [Treponema sp.]
MIESGYYTVMRLKNFVLILVFLNLLIGCAAMKGIADLNTLPENSLRGNPSNTVNAIEYVSEVLVHPAGREIIAYNRRVFNANNPRGKIFNYHSFYVFLKDGQFEHTLVFSDTPRGSKYKECWMLDAKTDVDSYNLFIYSDNPWDVEEYIGPNGEATLNVVLTAQNILDRIDKNYRFFGPAIVRKLAWYHQLWMFLVPPPIMVYGPLLLISIHTDDCVTAVLDTMAWE